MRLQLGALLIGGALIDGGAAALAHHSFAMFDQEHAVELEGTVQEFKFTAPHAFIILAVKQEDGRVETWSLEGVSPSALVREGWSRTTLKPGDELKLRVAPLRSGAPGGAWVTQHIHFRDGKAVVVLSP